MKLDRSSVPYQAKVNQYINQQMYLLEHNTSIKHLHVSPLGFYPQGVQEQTNTSPAR
jgi:hypothetical protein